MSHPNPEYSRNDLITLGLVLLFAIATPVVIPIRHFIFSTSAVEPSGVPAISFMAAVFFAGLNFYTACARGPLHWLRHRNLENFKHVSPLPLIGSVCAMYAALTMQNSFQLGMILLISIFLDSGGAQWLAYGICLDFFRIGNNGG